MMPAQDVDEDTRRFQAQSARLMGDMKEAGDAPFGGEVELDSKVRHFHPAPSCQAGGAMQKEISLPVRTTGTCVNSAMWSGHVTGGCLTAEIAALAVLALCQRRQSLSEWLYAHRGVRLAIPA